LHHLRGHYPSFLAHTSSCARPKSSSRLCIWCSSERSLQVAASPCWKWALPDVRSASLSLGAWVSIPAEPRGAFCSFLPTLYQPSPRDNNRSALHNNPLSNFRAEDFFGMVTIRYLQAPRFACHPGRSYRCSRWPTFSFLRLQGQTHPQAWGLIRRCPSRLLSTYRAAVTFTSEQNTCRYLHVHRIY
jgi:hypothetical protein